MNLDFELLKNILVHIEDVGDGEECHTVTRETLSDSRIQSATQCESFTDLAYHFDILVNNQFVNGQVLRMQLGGHKVASYIDYFNLTLGGHQLLDSMRNETIWNKIKSRAHELGVEGLRQIPGLAISLFTGNSA